MCIEGTHTYLRRYYTVGIEKIMIGSIYFHFRFIIRACDALVYTTLLS